MSVRQSDARVEAPPIAMAPKDGNRPCWSVMIPAYDPREDYLEQTLGSVLAQDPGPDRMQIEVVDDCSPRVDVATIVKRIGGDRVACSRTGTNLGLAGCWNTCIDRSRGLWVHILHQDDYILPRFYEHLGQIASAHPEVSLIATRSFLIDEMGIIEGVTSRVRELESGSRAVTAFFYDNQIRCPGIVVRRNFYEENGGFRADLTFTLDYEMWVRAISNCGGIVTPKVMASYRNTTGNETHRLVRAAEIFEDYSRLIAIFAERFPEFDCAKAKRQLCGMAIMYAERFAKTGDHDAASANLRYWRRNAPASQRLRHSIGSAVRRILG